MQNIVKNEPTFMTFSKHGRSQDSCMVFAVNL